METVPRRQTYKGRVIEVRVFERIGPQPSWVPEFSIIESDGAGVTDTEFFIRQTYASERDAIEAAIAAGKSKIDDGFTASQS